MLFIDYGVDVDVWGGEYYMVLYVVVFNGYEKVVKLLVEWGVMIDVIDLFNGCIVLIDVVREG